MSTKIEKSTRKKFKKVEEKELPSFLSDLKVTNENTKKKDSNVYLGPIFFGCEQYHPPFYSLNLADTHQPLYTGSYKENVLEGLFLPNPEVEAREKEKKSFHPTIKRRKAFVDLYPHKCPGNKKIFKPEVVPPVIDLGQTESIIEGETSQEIPIYWPKKANSSLSEPEFELTTLSDICDRNRAFLPYNERMAHTHFPKEFVTVRVIGPTIPASLTITRIRSKRECENKLDESTEQKTTTEKSPTEDENKIIEEVKLDSPSGFSPTEEEENEKLEKMGSNVFEKDKQSEQYPSEMEMSVMSVEEESLEEEMSEFFSEEEEEEEQDDDENNPEEGESGMRN